METKNPEFQQRWEKLLEGELSQMYAISQVFMVESHNRCHSLVKYMWQLIKGAWRIRFSCLMKEKSGLKSTGHAIHVVKIPKSRCARFIENCPRSLSYNHWIKGLNTYLNEISVFWFYLTLEILLKALSLLLWKKAKFKGLRKLSIPTVHTLIIHPYMHA